MKQLPLLRVQDINATIISRPIMMQRAVLFYSYLLKATPVAQVCTEDQRLRNSMTASITVDKSGKKQAQPGR